MSDIAIENVLHNEVENYQYARKSEESENMKIISCLKMERFIGINRFL